MTFRAVAGVEYQFLVYGVDGATGPIQLNLFPATRPPNDEFANRVRLSARNETVTGTDFDAVNDPAEFQLQSLTDFVYPSGKMIWWEWTSPIDGAAQITTTNSYRIANTTTQPAARIVVFAGDTFPTNRSAVQFADAPQGRFPASIYLTDVRAGTHYQIGLDTVDWEQPSQFLLNIRAIAPPRILTSTAQILNGAFRARVEGTEGSNYRVTYSTNFTTWTFVSDHLNIPGEFTFETSNQEATRRFFRVEEIAAP
jgi:hypothetical protein